MHLLRCSREFNNYLLTGKNVRLFFTETNSRCFTVRGEKGISIGIISLFTLQAIA